MAAAIEQGHDERGIIFPDAIAPFTAAVAVIGAKNEEVMKAAESLYNDLQAAGIDTLLDDRDMRPGVMFAELDLMGIPHRFVVGARGLAKGEAEYKHRAEESAQSVPFSEAVAYAKERISVVSPT